MKSISTCKRLVSLLLATIIVVSMMTVGMVVSSAAETETATTGATTYYFGFTSWSSFKRVWMENSSGGKEYTSLVNCNTTVSHNIGNNVGNQTYNVYSLTVDTSYTTAYVKITNNNQDYETAAITLDSGKITLISEYGGKAQFGQTTYGGTGGGSTTSNIYLAGAFNGWSSSTNKFDLTTGTSYKEEITLAANTTYEFKIIKDGTWLGNGGTINNDVTGWTFDGSGNCKIKTTFEGTYTFTFDSSTNKLSVKYPTSGSGTTDPDDPDDPSDTVRIYLKDGNTSWEIESDDANFFVKASEGVIKMNETIDTISGQLLWYADVASSNTSFTFYRASYFCDESNAASKAWNSWTTSTRSSNTCYKVTASDQGTWDSTKIKPADLSTLGNFWFGFWVDTNNDLNTKTFVRSEFKNNVFSLYLPSYVDLTNVHLYTSFKSCTIKGGAYSTGKELAQGSPTIVTLATGTTYTLNTQDDNGTTKNGTYSLKVYTTTDTASMLMTTDEELFTGTTDGLSNSDAWPSGSGINGDNFNNIYKDAIETKGSIYVYSENGNLVNDGDGETKLKKIKGRGNSSFKGSMQVYGKYAYNFNLDKKVDLTVLDDGVTNASTASKKWCLLANNPDVTMMRNTFIYSLADDIGLKYAPETRLVDVYDNGKYLGAYIITEKVEYGKNTLMNDMKSLDDGNTEANSVYPVDAEGKPNTDADPLYEFDTDDLNSGETGTYKDYSYKYYATYDRPAYKDENGNTVAAATNLEYKSPTDYATKYNFLLEFELYDRYQNEASWFKSPRTGQAVVVKYPEFATKAEMEWIIDQYEKAESAIYENNNDFAKIDAAVDVDSFARMYLIQELAINLDSCATSYYIHNDQTTDKLVASPVWDYDWAFGSYAKDLKFIYNGSSVENSENMSNPKQMFVKNKALKTDSNDNTKTANYNFQAKLVHNSKVWERCQYYWTNLFVPNLARYVDNDYIDATSQKDDGVVEGRMLTQWLPKFRSSLAMNNARWGSVTFTGDDWGTKVTTDYVNRSFDFKVGNTGTSGNASKSYDNSVYYLNDWIVTRWNYMSGDGGLYDESQEETITAKNAAFTTTQDGANLTINASVEITHNGVRVDGDYPESITYDIYVNGVMTESNTLDKATTITLESGKESDIYIKAYLTNAPNTYAVSETVKFSYGISDYKVENVRFTAEQHDTAITVSPSATVTKNGVELTPTEIQYTVYVNGVAQATKTFAEGSATVTIESGKVSEIYIKVSPVGVTSVSGTSATEEFSFGIETVKVSVTFNFKSSASYRYLPKIKANGGEILDMNKDVLIGKNASQTQTYNWFTATVDLEIDKATNVTFSNAYSMVATTSITPASNGEVYYFGVDNLNDGSLAVDLTEFNTSDENDQKMLNFKQSASHMVYSSSLDPEIATTSINGRILKMGDTDEDNKLTVLDATNAQMALAKKTTLTPTGAAVSDYNLDGVSSIMDVTEVQTFLAQ